MPTTDTLESLVSDISKAIQSYAEKELVSRQWLAQLSNDEPALFIAAGIRAVAAAEPSDGSRYLIQTLAKDRRLSVGLLDPNVCSLEEAIAVARAAAEAGGQLQANFEIALNKGLQGQPSVQKTERILRILELLSLTCGQSCWNSFQVELMAYPDKVVRAKAALLIGRSTRNVQWIARRLLDRDTRVQASAVEALWGIEGEEAREQLLIALRSEDNRVTANAALGLYRIGDLSSIRILLDMAHHTDPLFRLSALWAIGETQNERFLPMLAEYYKLAEGKLRLGAVGAMSRIRRRERRTDPLQVHLKQAAVDAQGLRSLAFALSCHPARDLSGIKSTEFVLFENDKLIDDYDVRVVPPPAVLLSGFIVPWHESDGDPYEKALREGLKQCLSMKRPGDLWRIDRYSIEMNPSADSKSAGESLVPYHDSLITPDLKASFGCISDPGLFEMALTLTVPKERTAADPLAALERQARAFAKRGGKRHVFFFLHDMSGFDLKQETAVARLRTIAEENSLVLHGICPDVAGQWDLIRQLCLANPEGSFNTMKLAGLVDGLVDVYANLSSRFEVQYKLPAANDAAKARLKISSALGEADVPLELTRTAAPPSTTSESPAA